MNPVRDPAFAQNDRLAEQIMIEQLKQTHFPDVPAWNPEGIVAKEEEKLPVLTWESFRRFINGNTGVRIPRNAQIIITRHPGYSSVEHIHNYYEGCFILAGGGTHIISNHLEYVKEGDFSLIPPGARHDFEFRPDSLALCFSIHPSLFSGACSSLLDDDTAISRFLMDSLYQDNHEQYLLFWTGDDKTLRMIAMSMLQIMIGTGENTNRILSGLMLAFFARAETHPHSHIRNESPGSKLLDLELMNMIRKNYATITLTDLAKYLHYTVPHCSKYLKEHLGCTFSKLVQQMRFQAAEDYLTHSDMSVTRISETLGYENPENFIRAFKKTFGTTPIRYRQTHRQEN